MKLYLSSYKVGNQINYLKDWIAKNGNKICLVANSRDQWDTEGNERYTAGIQKDISELEILGFDVTELDLRKFFGKEKELQEFMQNHNAVYVIGGNTFVLRQAMKLSGFDNFIRSQTKNPNFLYSGYSAGVCVLSESMKGIELVDEPEVDPYNTGEVIYEGLGLIDYTPMVHYKSDHPETKLIDKAIEYANANNIKYKTLRDGEVIIKDTITGKEQIHKLSN